MDIEKPYCNSYVVPSGGDEVASQVPGKASNLD